MSAISTWSTTAASNNSASPDGFPEGMAPSGVNDSNREVMAAIRTQHEDAEWIDWGHTPTFVSSTSFTVTGDQTAEYQVNRRIKITDSSTLYGTIATSAYTTLTTVTVTLDSGSITSSISAVALGINRVTNPSIGGGAVKKDTTLTTSSGALGVNKFVSTAQSITADTTLTLAHSLGERPNDLAFWLKCTDAGGDMNYAQNNEYYLGSGLTPNEANNNLGFGHWADDTNVYIIFHATDINMIIMNKTTRLWGGIDASKWNLIVTARV